MASRCSCLGRVLFCLSLSLTSATCFVDTSKSTAGVWRTTTTTHPRTSALLQLSNQDEYEVDDQQMMQSSSHVRPEYAALYPGITVKIQVGNVGASRKAWKKRRRSGSPLLVPCSVLDMDRADMVRWNIIYLLQKFGTPLNELREPVGFTSKGVALSFWEIGKLYKGHLGSSLMKHATALGYDSSTALIRNLFNGMIQKEYGMRLWVPSREKDENYEEDHRPLWLVLPIARHRARAMGSQAGLGEFISASDISEGKGEDGDDEVSSLDQDSSQQDQEETPPRMRHTGIIRIRKRNNKKSSPVRFPHKFKSLSAAIRVSQRNIDEGLIENGAIMDASVFCYDSTGDYGAPILITALLKNHNNSHQLLSHRLKQVESKLAHPPLPIQHNLKDLKVGDGPFVAKVVRISPTSHAAFVDCNVGRTLGKHRGGGISRVWGMLRFDDLVPAVAPTKEDSDTMTSNSSESRHVEDGDDDWDEHGEDDHVMSVEDLFVDDDDMDEKEFEEEEEDITDSFAMNEEGVLTYQDAETGETRLMSNVEDHEEEEDDDDSPFAGLTSEERLGMIAQMLEESEVEETEATGIAEELQSSTEDLSAENAQSYEPMFISVGGGVDVYIKAISKQSGRFMVTTDPSIKDRKLKDIKKEHEVGKKLARLAARFGGSDGLEKILSFAGTECDGVVKATSNTGDWLYVQPNLGGLPVGVAMPSDETTSRGDSDAISQGDSVRVRLDGIDESRGQLAMTVLQKLAP